MAEILAQIRLSSGRVWSEFRRQGCGYALDWKEAALFEISKDGRRVRCRPSRKAAPVSLRVLKRLAQAYAGSLRGEESLHATALSFRGRAIALLGNSGEGKSTLAAQLVRDGWRLLSDDVLPFRVHHERVLVRGVSSNLKLSSSALGRVSDVALRQEFDPNLQKWIVRLPGARGTHALKGLFMLCRKGDGAVRAERLWGNRSALTLQASFYNEVFRGPAVLRRQFIAAARLACRVPLWRLSYPTGFKHLYRVAGLARNLVQ